MNIPNILTILLSAFFGGLVTFLVQSSLNKQKTKMDFKQKQLLELYQPLHELISQNTLTIQSNKHEKEVRYDLAYSIIELITKKSPYASRKLQLSIHSLRHHLKIENYNYKSLNEKERKVKVWSFKEDDNEDKLEAILERIDDDLHKLIEDVR